MNDQNLSPKRGFLSSSEVSEALYSSQNIRLEHIILGFMNVQQYLWSLAYQMYIYLLFSFHQRCGVRFLKGKMIISLSLD